MTLFDALYVIDGVPQEDTPRYLLTGELALDRTDFPELQDETVDPHLNAWTYRESEIPSHLEKMAAYPYPFSLRYPASSARLSLASALADTLWLEGRFSYDQLRLRLEWLWNDKELGALAAFYQTCEALGEYVESLRLEIDGLSHRPGALCELIPQFVIPQMAGAPNPPVRKIPAHLLPQENSWILYLPLDPCGFALGGSLLSKVCGNAGDGPVEVGDGDYLMDVYEIVREMVEDGIVLSGVTVARGGLMTALTRWSGPCLDGAHFSPEAPGTGMDLDIASLMKAYDLSEMDEIDRARALFGEVPAVLLQIRDEDYDYVDAQCLLQDVAYYALGHPSSLENESDGAASRIHISHNPVPVLSSLLQALISR